MAGDKLELEGTVIAARGNGRFLVLSEDQEIQCTLSGKIRQNNIRVLEGDKVKIEVSPYDTRNGRIVFRFKG